MEAVSQLDQDASIALATIREWRNSFSRVNRIPIEIISLVPTHLSSQKDRFRAASVCRRWRGAFLKHGTLWSRLFLRRGEEYLSTLLKRAKGSALDVIFDCWFWTANTITLISNHARQIRSIEFILCNWQDILAFESNSGRLPLLRTLKIVSLKIDASIFPAAISPPVPIFRDSIDLKQFIFHCRCWELQLLSHFVYPNLTTFELSSDPGGECSASHLLDFLKASPLLRMVEMKIFGTIILASIPEGTVVVLPDVETFSLHMVDGPSTQIYDLASHISCPRARYTSLTHEVDEDDMMVGLGLFPTPDSWNTIVCQYMANPIEEVTLEINDSTDEDLECFLAFRSSDATTVRLGFNVDETGEVGLLMDRAEMGWEIFSQALTTIRDHPLLPHVKRLHIKYKATAPDTYETRMADKVRELFGSLEPLDELTICGCDLRIFLRHFLRGSWFNGLETPLVFLQAKKLTILHPSVGYNAVGCARAILELAKLQHALAIPFERVTISTGWFPIRMKGELERWVGAVDYSEEKEEAV